jgi:hypothetical protein
MTYSKEGLRNSISVTTISGLATTSLLLDRPGELQVTVQSGLARQSDTVKVFIPDAGSIIVTVLPPDVTPASTASPTETPGAERGGGTGPPDETAAGGTNLSRDRHVNFQDWLIAVLGLLAICSVEFWIGYQTRNLNQGLLLALPTFVTGLAGYNYYALLLPGTGGWFRLFGEFWSPALATWISGVLGFALTEIILYGRVKRLPSLLRGWLNRR